MDKREREQAEKDREQARTKRAIERKEKELSESRQKLNKDVKTVAAERDRVDDLKSEYEQNKAVIEQTRETAEKIKDIRIDTLEIPEPQGKGIHKNYYTREQVEDLTREVNKAREQARSIGQGREVESLDERLARASHKANENIKEKALERLQEENRKLQKDKDFVDWLEKNMM